MMGKKLRPVSVVVEEAGPMDEADGEAWVDLWARLALEALTGEAAAPAGQNPAEPRPEAAGTCDS